MKRLKGLGSDLTGLLLFVGCLLYCLGSAYAISATIVGALFIILRPYIAEYEPWQKYLLGIAAIGAVLPGDPLLPLVFAFIIGFWYFLKDMKPESIPYATMLITTFFAALSGLIPVDAFATEPTGVDKGLKGVLTRIQGIAGDVKTVAPTIGYAAGLGFGGTGLMEIVKSKQGNGGDFGGGMKKLLIGGGLAGITAMLNMAKSDMTNNK